MAMSVRGIRRRLATSDHWAALLLKKTVLWIEEFTLPAPRVVVKPMLWAYLILQALYRYPKRVLICEPIFKAYCTQYGRRVRTSVHIHWVQGKGDLIVGDDVLIDGKCGFSFAARYVDRPRLVIGDHTGIGNNCGFSVGKSIVIGRHCRIAANVWIFDSSGHPTDPKARLAGLPPSADDVRPVTIADNVWIGGRAIIFPGVTVGEGSVVSAGSVVMTDVPPYTVVAGNPARKIASLATRPAEGRPSAPEGVQAPTS